MGRKSGTPLFLLALFLEALYMTEKVLRKEPDHSKKEKLDVTYSGVGDVCQVSVPSEQVVELISPFDGRKRAFLVGLLNGRSRSMAAAGAGITLRTIQLWEKSDPGFRDASVSAEQIGFAGVIESELYRRALAGHSDRGSMRALELVVKSRDASYREKSQITLDVVQRAEEAGQRLVSGWESS
jgi:hypothetical protein